MKLRPLAYSACLAALPACAQITPPGTIYIGGTQNNANIALALARASHISWTENGGVCDANAQYSTTEGTFTSVGGVPSDFVGNVPTPVLTNVQILAGTNQDAVWAKVVAQAQKATTPVGLATQGRLSLHRAFRRHRLSLRLPRAH